MSGKEEQAVSCCSNKVCNNSSDADQHATPNSTGNDAQTLEDAQCTEGSCDDECIKAVAAIECHAACETTSGQSASADTEHVHQHDEDGRHLVDACADHLRAAFDRYAKLLEQTQCICRSVLAEEKIKCSNNDARAPINSTTAVTTAHQLMYQTDGARRIRARKRSLPCLDKSTRDRTTMCHAISRLPAKRLVDKHIDGPCCPSSRDLEITAVAPLARDFASSGDVERNADTEQMSFNVDGMDCTGCEKILTKALERLPGVKNVRVTFVTASASFDINTKLTTPDEAIRHAQRATGYKLWRIRSTENTLDISLPVDVYNSWHLLPRGISSVEVLSKTSYRISYDSALIGARGAFQHFTGASLLPPSEDPSLKSGLRRVQVMLISTTAAFVLTIPVIVLAWSDISASISVQNKYIVELVLATAVQSIAIPEFYIPALSSLFLNHTVEMDMLVVLSITVAYIYSLVAFSMFASGRPLETEPFFETSTLLISLILLGRLIAAYARKRAIAAVSLRSLQPTMATLAIDDAQQDVHEELTIDARLLEVSDKVIVKAHTQIVTDGDVLYGVSEVDESMITGESMPVTKVVGSAVTAGTMNGGGQLLVRVSRLPGRNTISDIANLVNEARETKPRVQDLADKLASYFVPVVLVIAAVVVAIWVAVNIRVYGQPASSAVVNAITYGVAVLAVSCPCALGLAVPMVVVITSGKAARAGIVIKTPDVIERGFRVTDVVLDKTGTLTEDKLTVVAQQIFENAKLSDIQTIDVIHALVRESSHPVARAVALWLTDRTTNKLSMENLQSLPGAGLTASYNGLDIAAGNAEWLGVHDKPQVNELLAQGLSLLCVTGDGELLAIFGLRTTLRAEAKAVVDRLQQDRKIRVHIVSGDTQQAALSVASELGVPSHQVWGRHSPSDKQQYVRTLIDQGRTVLFCGDGTNDAVAVTQADVGVQIASAASEVTKATADVVLLNDDLRGLVQLLDLSRASFIRICINFGWAALYNVFAILLAGGAFVRVRIQPAYAGLGELVSILPVIVVAMTIRASKAG